MKSYVVDVQKKFVVQEGNQEHCLLWVQTCKDLWGHRAARYIIVEGAKNLDQAIKNLKSTNLNWEGAGWEED